MKSFDRVLLFLVGLIGVIGLRSSLMLTGVDMIIRTVEEVNRQGLSQLHWIIPVGIGGLVAYVFTRR